LYEEDADGNPIEPLDKPGSLIFEEGRSIQAVVKAQKIVVRHDKPYRGLWHDEGLHENIAAVVVYYYSVPSSLRGGQMQLASKASIGTNMGTTREVRAGWRKRARARVAIEQGKLLVFNNLQAVHRVLELQNTGAVEASREFVALFVIHPRFPLPTAMSTHFTRTELLTKQFPRDLCDTVLEYSGDFMRRPARMALREIVFKEQMVPRSLGGFVMISCGNCDCRSVAWTGGIDGTRDRVEALWKLRGTSSDEGDRHADIEGNEYELEEEEDDKEKDDDDDEDESGGGKKRKKGATRVKKDKKPRKEKVPMFTISKDKVF